MKLACKTRRERRRLRIGLIELACAVVAAIWASLSGPGWVTWAGRAGRSRGLTLAALLDLRGPRGWCALRALGFRTACDLQEHRFGFVWFWLRCKAAVARRAPDAEPSAPAESTGRSALRRVGGEGPASRPRSWRAAFADAHFSRPEIPPRDPAARRTKRRSVRLGSLRKGSASSAQDEPKGRAMQRRVVRARGRRLAVRRT